MLKDYLLPVVVDYFIKVLEQYNNSSYFRVFSLNKAKLQYSIKFQSALQRLRPINNLNDIESLQNLLVEENRPRSGSELTAPPRGEEVTYWDTPHMRSPGISYLHDNQNNDFNDFILQQRIYLHELRKKHGKHSVGRLDGIFYAMSRVTLFMNWVEENVAFDDNIHNRTALDHKYIGLIKILSDYISIFSFDRALLRFHDQLHSINGSYYLGSGLYNAFFYGRKTLKEIDSIGNTLINSLYLLSEAYADPEQEQASKQSALEFILKNLINNALTFNSLNSDMFNSINEQVFDGEQVLDIEESKSPAPPPSKTPDFFNSADHEDLIVVPPPPPPASSPMLFMMSPRIVPSPSLSRREAEISSPKPTIVAS